MVHAVTARLARRPSRWSPVGWRSTVGLCLYPTWSTTWDLLADEETRSQWTGSAIGLGTVNAFSRRLLASKRDLARLIRGDLASNRPHHVNTAESAKVSVVDLHHLPERAQRFVVGVILRSEFERKEKSGAARPLLFVVLDELNKYAPGKATVRSRRCCWTSPSVAAPWGDPDRGAADRQRSGAADRGQLGHPGGGRLIRPRPPTGVRFRPRAAAAGAAGQTRHHVRQPAGDPGAVVWSSVPGLGHPPAEAGAAPAGTLRSITPGRRPVRGGRRRGRGGVPVLMKILHTSDWHVGKVLKRASPGWRSTRRCWPNWWRSPAESLDLILVAGDLSRHRRSHPVGPPGW